MTDEKKTVIQEAGQKTRTNEVIPISDNVMIEIVHAFKDIIIAYINRKYPGN